jgi:hypothetical protein
VVLQEEERTVIYSDVQCDVACWSQVATLASFRDSDGAKTVAPPFIGRASTPLKPAIVGGHLFPSRLAIGAPRPLTPKLHTIRGVGPPYPPYHRSGRGDSPRTPRGRQCRSGHPTEARGHLKTGRRGASTFHDRRPRSVPRWDFASPDHAPLRGTGTADTERPRGELYFL